MKEIDYMNEPVTTVTLFDPNANEENKKMFHGETSGQIDMIDQTINNFYQKHTEKMFANAWHPIKYSVSDDMKDMKKLQNLEKETMDKCLSHLTNLDSLQVKNLPTIASKLRYPEIVGVLSYQEMEESLHSFSYAYIYNSLYSKEEARRVRDLIKTDPVMRARAIELKESYESLDDTSTVGMLKILLTNLVLEGVMFYSIFNFFFSLKYKGTMINTAIIISWIKKNEVTHIDIFVDILQQFKKDYPEAWDEEFITDYLIKQTEKESEYSTYIIDNRLLGFSKDNIVKYTKHRMNRIFRMLDLEYRFEDIKNPFLHLERAGNVADDDEIDVNSTETGIFEAHSTNYFSPHVKIKDYEEFANAK